jgi:YidC/Oxa1 family membrane protein insertase
MDRKAILVVGVSVAFIFVWMMVIVPKYFTHPLPPRPTNAVAAAQAPEAPTTPAGQPPELTASTNAAAPFVPPSAAEETLTLTNANARYVFTSHGGGLKQIELLQYPEFVAHGVKANPNRVATLNTKAPVPVMALLGEPALTGDGLFKLTRTANGVRAEKALTNGLTVVKDFRPTSNYLFTATVRIENHSAGPVALGSQEWVIGTATPMSALDKNADTTVGLMWSDGVKAYDTLKTWFDNRSFTGCITGQQEPRTEFRAGSNNVAWASVHNQFFALIAMPPTNAFQVVAHPIQLPRPSADELPPGAATPRQPVGFQTALGYPGLTLTAGGALERTLTFYGGPKEYRQLAEISEQQGHEVDRTMGFGFFGIVSKALLWGMNLLHDTFRVGYGWAIVVITIIIKTCFWPLTTASTRSMKRMAALQPQMKELQEKYKDDPTKLNQKMMAFWKEHKVNPMGGCWPMLLQVPVFFGFFSMIRSAIELRGAHFLWVQDLSQPDTLFYAGGFPVNLLPLLMGVTMLWQARLTPPSPGMDPTQQKMMRYMPLMFMVFLYNYSAALTLYWTTQNLLTILQTKLTKAKDPVTPAPAPAVVRKRK